MSAYSGLDNLEVMREALNYNRFLVDLVLSGARAGDRVVDFGAGSGTFARPVQQAGHDIRCIETDATLSSHLALSGLQVHADLEGLANGSVGYLYSLNVLEHIADDQATVDQWFRKLRPGGRLLVYVPAFELLFSSMDRKVGHHRRYRLPGLKGKLRASGFVIDEGRYADSLGFVATLAFKLLGSDKGDIEPRALKFYDRVCFPLSRALDRVAGRMAGKNVYVRAHKPAGAVHGAG